MATKTTDITVGTATLSGTTYYGHDSGPTLFYGSIDNRFFTGANGKDYSIHACRWTGGNSTVSVYLRLDHPDILATDGYTTYKTVIFSSLTIGSLTLNSSAITSGFTVDGGVGFYWANISTNPFSSVGTDTTISLAGVQEGPYGFQIFDSAGDLKVNVSSNIIALADVSTNVTVAKNNGTFTKSVSELDNSGVWYVFLDGTLVNSSNNPIYTAYYKPEITYNTGSYTLTNGNTAYDWKGTVYTYRTA